MSNTSLLADELVYRVRKLQRVVWVNAIIALLNIIMVPVILSLEGNLVSSLVVMVDIIVSMGTSIVVGGYLRDNGETLGGYYC